MKPEKNVYFIFRTFDTSYLSHPGDKNVFLRSINCRFGSFLKICWYNLLISFLSGSKCEAPPDLDFEWIWKFFQLEIFSRIKNIRMTEVGCFERSSRLSISFSSYVSSSLSHTTWGQRLRFSFESRFVVGSVEEGLLWNRNRNRSLFNVTAGFI